MSSKWRYEDKTKEERNFIGEAVDLIKGLSRNQMHDLYEVVSAQLRKSNNKSRDKELMAVKLVLERIPSLDQGILRKAREGYKSSMAQEARAKDGNTIKYKKKV